MFGKYCDSCKKCSAVCCYADLMPTPQATQCTESSFVWSNQEIKSERYQSLSANSVMFSSMGICNKIIQKTKDKIQS